MLDARTVQHAFTISPEPFNHIFFHGKFFLIQIIFSQCLLLKLFSISKLENPPPPTDYSSQKQVVHIRGKNVKNNECFKEKKIDAGSQLFFLQNIHIHTIKDQKLIVLKLMACPMVNAAAQLFTYNLRFEKIWKLRRD